MLLALLLPLIASLSQAQTRVDVFTHPTLEIGLAGLGVDTSSSNLLMPCINGDEIETAAVKAPHFRIRYAPDPYNPESIVLTLEAYQTFKTYTLPKPYEILDFQTHNTPAGFKEKCGDAFISERTEGAHAAFTYSFQKSLFMRSELVNAAFETDDQDEAIKHFTAVETAMLNHRPDTNTQSFDSQPFLIDAAPLENLYPLGPEMMKTFLGLFAHSHDEYLLQALEIVYNPYPAFTFKDDILH